MNNQSHTQGTAWNGPSGANAVEFRRAEPQSQGVMNRVPVED
jgi:hypothetical protein